MQVVKQTASNFTDLPQIIDKPSFVDHFVYKMAGQDQEVHDEFEDEIAQDAAQMELSNIR